MLIRCRCLSVWQDKQYGPGMRVHNQTKKSDSHVYRCTICQDEKNIGSQSRDKKK